MINDINDWSIHDTLTVEEASMLAVGINPAEITLIFAAEGRFRHKYTIVDMYTLEDDQDSFFSCPKFIIFFTAVNRAISAEKININIDGEISVVELKNWMREKNIPSDFFFPEAIVEDFQNKDHPRYSPKLACAVAAWKAVETAGSTKSVKQTLRAWVSANAVTYGVVEANGLPSESAIEDIAKIANWATNGGANPTGGEVSEPLESSGK